jgi:nitroreductase
MNMSYTMWDISENDFPESGSIEDKIRFWLRYAILAPSAHNTQPWQFNITGNNLQISRDEVHTLKRGDPTLRETTLGIGACIENFHIAARHWHFDVQVKSLLFTVNDKEIANMIISESQSKASFFDIFPGIQKRHTNRGFYDSTPLNAETLNALHIPLEPEVELFFITDEAVRSRIADLVGRGTNIALGMPVMKRELAELVFRVEENPTTGMVVEALTESPPHDQSGSDWVLQSLDSKKEAVMWKDAFLTSPLHVVVGTLHDGPEAWLAAGRVMERLLVVSANLGLAHCIAAAPIEIPTLTPELRKEIPNEYRPQVLVRLGTPTNPSYTIESGRRNPKY